MPLNGHTNADYRWLGSGILTCQLTDVIRGHTGNRRDLLGWVDRCPLLELVKAQRVLLNIVVINQVLMEDHIDHPERQCAVSARTDGDMPVSPPGSTGFYRVNHDHLGTLCLGLGNEWPVVQVGADRITRPQYDVFRVFKAFGIGARCRANSHEVGSTGARVAEGALTDGCP